MAQTSSMPRFVPPPPPMQPFFTTKPSNPSFITLPAQQLGDNSVSQPRGRPSGYSPNTLAPVPLLEPGRRHIRSVSAEPVLRTPAPVPNPIPRPQPAALPSPGQKNDAVERLQRRSWVPGSSSKPEFKHGARIERIHQAWIAGHDGKPPYDVRPLLAGDRVPELWDESGDTFVYLCPPASGRGPSFKVRSYIYSSSAKLTRIANGGNHPVHSGEVARRLAMKQSMGFGVVLPDTPPPTPPRNNSRDDSSSGSSRHTRDSLSSFDETTRQFHLYFPVTLSNNMDSQAQPTIEDVDALIAVRNLFAFLLGQSLIATERRNTVFDIFMNIAKLLQGYEFTNIDGSTFGEVAATSFDCYVRELHIADVRTSREKTIEALVLGEKMRSVMLYNEGFTHAVGKYNDIQNIAQAPGPGSKFNLLNPATRSRMERASIDLAQREKSISDRLVDFDFPSIFAGVMSSKTVEERKHINFDAWKSAFLATRRHVLGYYKQKFGSWPPKASSKKNRFEMSGLNRLVLKQLYADFSDFYDLYVDRTSLTPRSMGKMDSTDTDATGGADEPVRRILRRVCDEYDRAYPPVQPPIPFDTPLLPNARRDSATRAKKLNETETIQVLNASANSDKIPLADFNQLPFLAQIRAFERQQCRNSSLTEIIDFRAGMWIFMYAVLQALPMVVVDAPGVHYSQGVEYFLCQPPRGGVPWAKGVGADGSTIGKNGQSWYSISGGNGVVSLPSDLIEHGVEGVYRRSHCWIMAAKWSESVLPVGRYELDSEIHASRSATSVKQQPARNPPYLETSMTAAPRGRNTTPQHARAVSASPAVATRRPLDRAGDNALSAGLQALPLPPGVSPAVATGPRPLKPRESSPAGYHLTPDSSVASGDLGVRGYSPSCSSSRAVSPSRPMAQGYDSSKAAAMTFDGILASIGR